MVTCRSCSADNSDASKFCSECGAALKWEYEATVTHGAGGVPADSGIQSSLSDTSHHGRFLPGTKVADRYRIVSLVGRGGMGEVYRADDLKLGHTVALKFLPKDLAKDPQRLEYFHSEVRLTRQISHPNVCRVYDIGEVDGQHFLSMEYIDGEDLKILLRRIGRLPQDKGVEIAQQLCAGLAAAHERGVLHRDLKPANIMLDGRGQVRITDFGLAKLAVDAVPGEVAGTPAYMAPEQLARGETTIQSDLYSLGLILYELFTGQQVHKPGSIPELLHQHQESSFSQPSKLVDDLDPVVERVILRCLAKEPHERPTSALAVSAALPGGDPLAAALAAGETPSPEMVAAAGETGQLSLKLGSGLFAAICVLLLAIPFVADRLNRIHLDELVNKPDILERRATDLIAELGHPVRTAGSVHGFQLNESKDGLEFWYRQSSGSLVPNLPALTLRPIDWRVTVDNPPPHEPGMVSVRLDPSGNLLELLAVPTSDGLGKPAELKSSWEEALLGYGFDLDEYDKPENPPDVLPPIYADEVLVRRAKDPEVAQRYVVLAFRSGRVVYFHRFNAKPSRKETGGEWKVGLAALNLIVLVFLAGWLALRHLRRGRADVQGALRFALYFFSIDLVMWAVALHHDGSSERELVLGLSYLVRSLAYSLRVWLYYVAFEPLVRRFWPDLLISWSRLLAGRFSDPQIGRDLLVACLWAVIWTLFNQSLGHLEYELEPDAVLGGRFTVALVLNAHQRAGVSGLYYLTALLLARMLLRNNWLAAAAFAALMTVSWWRGELTDPLVVSYAVFFGVLAAVYIRFGLLCAMFVLFVNALLTSIPFAVGFSWYADASHSALVVVLLLAAYGFYTSTLAGRSLISDDL